MSEEEKEYIEHEIVDRLYCLEEKDFDKSKVEDSYIQAVLKAGKENKNLVEKLKKELEEKTTILMAGAEKVKQLEKENKELKEDKKELFEEYQKRLKEKFDLEQKISDIIENSYNDIDYFNRDMRKDFEDLLEE